MNTLKSWFKETFSYMVLLVSLLIFSFLKKGLCFVWDPTILQLPGLLTYTLMQAHRPSICFMEFLHRTHLVRTLSTISVDPWTQTWPSCAIQSPSFQWCYPLPAPNPQPLPWVKPSNNWSGDFFFFNFNWRLITLQYCGVFCHTFTWISHGCTGWSLPNAC